MSAVHPASAGLRQMADMLDAIMDEGFAPPARLEFTLTKETFTAVAKRLGLQVQPIPKNADKWSIVRATRQIGGLEVHGWNWLHELHEKKTVMREVDVWECAGTTLDRI